MHLPKSFPLANVVEHGLLAMCRRTRDGFGTGSAMTQLLWMGSSLASLYISFPRAEHLLG